MAKFEPVITKELQETVRKNPNIKAVYFDDKGNHYFTKHTIEVHTDNGSGISKGSKTVEALPGVKQGVLKVQIGKEVKDKKVNTEYNAIACEMDREDILDAEIEEVEDVKVDAKKLKEFQNKAAKQSQELEDAQYEVEELKEKLAKAEKAASAKGEEKAEKAGKGKEKE